jgi:hypothetical protein
MKKKLKGATLQFLIFKIKQKGIKLSPYNDSLQSMTELHWCKF